MSQVLYHYECPETRRWSIQEIERCRRLGAYPGDEVFVEAGKLATFTAVSFLRFPVRCELLYVGRTKAVKAGNRA